MGKGVTCVKVSTIVPSSAIISLLVASSLFLIASSITLSNRPSPLKSTSLLLSSPLQWRPWASSYLFHFFPLSFPFPSTSSCNSLYDPKAWPRFLVRIISIKCVRFTYFLCKQSNLLGLVRCAHYDDLLQVEIDFVSIKSSILSIITCFGKCVRKINIGPHLQIMHKYLTLLEISSAPPLLVNLCIVSLTTSTWFPMQIMDGLCLALSLSTELKLSSHVVFARSFSSCHVKLFLCGKP